MAGREESAQGYEPRPMDSNCAARLLEANLRDGKLSAQELKWLARKFEGMVQGDVFAWGTTLH